MSAGSYGSTVGDGGGPARLVVLVSGTGTLLQSLLDESGDPAFGAEVVAVGSDRDGIEGLRRAQSAGVPSFTLRVGDFAERPDWDVALTGAVAAHRPDLVISAGFMKLVGKTFLHRFGGRFINTHPTLLPSFPGMHGPRDALAHGVKLSGCTVFFVDEGVDAGPIIAQAAVPLLDSDDVPTLHERIKSVERTLLVATVGRMCRDGWSISGRKVSIP